MRREETTLLPIRAQYLRPLAALSRRFRSRTGTSVLLKTPGVYTRVPPEFEARLPVLAVCSKLVSEIYILLLQQKKWSRMASVPSPTSFCLLNSCL